MQKTDKVRISAIVSAYYAEEFLAGRIENLLAQTIPVDIIVVCQEKSAEDIIASDYFPEVRVIRTSNVPTIYRAWNIAINEMVPADIEYVTNANCDDRLRERSLQEMVRSLDKNPGYALAYGNQEIVEEICGDVVGEYRWASGGLPELLHGCFIGPQPVWRRSLHDKYGYFDEAMHVAGDYEFWLRLAAGGEKFYHIDAAVGQYLRRKNSAEVRQPVRTVWETARARARYRGEP